MLYIKPPILGFTMHIQQERVTVARLFILRKLKCYILPSQFLVNGREYINLMWKMWFIRETQGRSAKCWCDELAKTCAAIFQLLVKDTSLSVPYIISDLSVPVEQLWRKFNL
jgi:hypothetical protein